MKNQLFFKEETHRMDGGVKEREWVSWIWVGKEEKGVSNED